MRNYETVFILNPVLSDEQTKEAVGKFTSFLKTNGGEIVSEEKWGLKKLAYPIQKKNSGFYFLVQFTANPEVIGSFETELRRDEKVMRFLTVHLDKYATEYAVTRRAKMSNAKKA